MQDPISIMFVFGSAQADREAGLFWIATFAALMTVTGMVVWLSGWIKRHQRKKKNRRSASTTSREETEENAN